MDYRKMLLAYINHVGEAEGVTFIDDDTTIPSLNAEENAELIRLNGEALQNYRNSKNQTEG